jgi:hypothetical protein
MAAGARQGVQKRGLKIFFALRPELQIILAFMAARVRAAAEALHPHIKRARATLSASRAAFLGVDASVRCSGLAIVDASGSSPLSPPPTPLPTSRPLT